MHFSLYVLVLNFVCTLIDALLGLRRVCSEVAPNGPMERQAQDRARGRSGG